MTQQEFELRVLRLWTATRVPMTRANVQAFTKAPRESIQKWMDAMVTDGVAELDSDDAGEMHWTVRGSARSANGPRTIGEAEALERLSKEVDAMPERGIVVRDAGGARALQRVEKK